MFKNLKVQQSWSQAVGSRNMAQITNIGLVGLVLLLGFKVINQEPVVIVTPPSFSKNITVQGDQVSEHYKTSWAIYAASTMGNINPRNVEFNKNIIIEMLSPNLQETVGSKVERVAEIMRTRKVTRNFTVQDAVYDPKNDVVYVWGKRVESQLRQEPLTYGWTYEISIESRLGMPRITYIKQYKGTPSKSAQQGKKTIVKPEYLSNSIDDVTSGYTQKEKLNGVEGLGYEPDISPKREVAKGSN